MTKKHTTDPITELNGNPSLLFWLSDDGYLSTHLLNISLKEDVRVTLLPALVPQFCVYFI